MRAQEKQQEFEKSSQEIPRTIEIFVKEIKTTPSKVFTQEELKGIVKSFEGRVLTGQDLTKLLGEINARYVEKGYIVCQAIIRPQRVRGGVLVVTLIEGKTGKVSAINPQTQNGQLTDTRESYVLRAFPLPQGQISNYRELRDQLITFNMVNDIQLSLDLHAGEERGTTDYTFNVYEPEPRAYNIFTDSLGTRSTGRLRVGAGFTERSLLGWRDRFQLVGLASEGSQSLLGAYSVPLNSMGTRAIVSLSLGKVKVIKGAGEDSDIKGGSKYYSFRLEHPVHVTADSKWTVFGQASRQVSHTNMFRSFKINNTAINSGQLGFDWLQLTEKGTFYGGLSYNQFWATDYIFEHQAKYRRLDGNAYWNHNFYKNWSYTVSTAFQKKLGAGDAFSSDYFFLGNSGGVRGYDNDVLSAESGIWANLELTCRLDSKGSRIYGFFDAGRLSGESVYTRNYISSVGLGVTWVAADWINASVIGAFPLQRNLATGEHVNKGRIDFVVSAFW